MDDVEDFGLCFPKVFEATVSPHLFNLPLQLGGRFPLKMVRHCEDLAFSFESPHPATHQSGRFVRLVSVEITM